MKVLVTGATGFLGQRLVRQLLGDGLTVRCFVRPSSDVKPLRQAAALALDRLEIFEGSLSRPDCCAEAVAGCQTVFHLAAALRGAPAVLFMNNVVATRTLIEASLREQVGRFVLVSSLAVYGTAKLCRWDTVDEHCPLDPEPHRRDGYTYSKLAQERAAWDAHQRHGLPLAVIRPGVIYGPGRDCLSGRIGLLLGRFLVCMGGRQPLPYTFVDNCARGILLAGATAAAEGEAFNIVDDDPPTAKELVRLYRAEVGRLRGIAVPGWAIAPLSALCEWYHRWSRGQLPAVLTPYKSKAMWRPLRYSNANAKAILGWCPEIDFSAGLKQTFSWLRDARASRQTVCA